MSVRGGGVGSTQSTHHTQNNQSPFFFSLDFDWTVATYF